MKKTLIVMICVFLTGCTEIEQMKEQKEDNYCSGELGLQKGTEAYANCRLQYRGMEQQKSEYSGTVWRNSWQNAFPAPQYPQQYWIHYY